MGFFFFLPPIALLCFMVRGAVDILLHVKAVESIAVIVSNIHFRLTPVYLVYTSASSCLEVQKSMHGVCLYLRNLFLSEGFLANRGGWKPFQRISHQISLFFTTSQ